MNRCSFHDVAALLVMLVCVSNPGCGERNQTGPPTLHLGSDVCDFCKMIISDQNYAAACVVRSTDGRVHTAAFDDIGCMLAYQKALAEGTIEQRYVTDYASGQWMDASGAYYLQSQEVRSPMASGIIASRTQAGADRLADRFGAVVFTYDDLGSRADANAATDRLDQSIPARMQTNDAALPNDDLTNQEAPE